MRLIQRERTPEPSRWVVSPELVNGKGIDSVWVSALTEKGAEEHAVIALKILGISQNQITGFSTRKLEDFMSSY